MNDYVLGYLQKYLLFIVSKTSCVQKDLHHTLQFSELELVRSAATSITLINCLPLTYLARSFHPEYLAKYISLVYTSIMAQEHYLNHILIKHIPSDEHTIL